MALQDPTRTALVHSTRHDAPELRGTGPIETTAKRRRGSSVGGRSLIGGIALLALLLVPACKEGPTDVWVVAGQSNAVGHSQIPAVFGWPPPPKLGPAFVWAAGIPRWRTVQWGAIHSLSSTTIGPWPAFASLRQAETNGPQLLVATAAGGTGLVPGRDKGDGNGGRWYPGGVFRGVYYPQGDLYRRMVATAKASQTHCTAVLWLQGEYESEWWWDNTPRDLAAADDARTTYRDALEDFGDAVAADLQCPVVAMPISLIQCAWDQCPEPPSTKRLPIHNGTMEAWGKHNVLPGVTIDDLRANPGDKAHIFDVFTLAQRWLQAVDNDGF